MSEPIQGEGQKKVGSKKRYVSLMDQMSGLQVKEGMTPYESASVVLNKTLKGIKQNQQGRRSVEESTTQTLSETGEKIRKEKVRRHEAGIAADRIKDKIWEEGELEGVSSGGSISISQEKPAPTDKPQ